MNEGDEWADTVRNQGLGIVIEGKEVEDWKQAMLQLCQDSLLRARMKANIAKMKPQLHWRQCIEPLYQYVMQKRCDRVPDRSLARRAG
jgi:glycosyltransferase involved in cell wall biosynthesis